MLNLGLKDQRQVISQLRVGSTQISQLRAAVSGAIGGGLRFSNNTIVYGVKSAFDFSNALGPNLRPEYFMGGVVGLSDMYHIGVPSHNWPF